MQSVSLFALIAQTTDRKVEKMKNVKVNMKYVLGVILALCFSTLLFATPKQAEAAGGTWHNYGYGWWYERDDGSYPTDQWENIYGKWYFFNGDGYAHCGDYAWINNAWYAFNWDCSMCEGWFWDAGYQNYFYAQPGSGYLHTNCWSWVNGYWYGFEANSEMSRGWTLGAFNTWYYCAPYSGIQTNSGYWYPEGCMYWSDWAWIDGYCYYFWGNGAMAVNCWVDGSWVDANGHWSPSGETFVPLSDQDRDEAIGYLNQVRAEMGLRPVVLDNAMQYISQLSVNFDATEDGAIRGVPSSWRKEFPNNWGSLWNVLFYEWLLPTYNARNSSESGVAYTISNEGNKVKSFRTYIEEEIEKEKNGLTTSYYLNPTITHIGLASNIFECYDPYWDHLIYSYGYQDLVDISTGETPSFGTAIPGDFPKDVEWYHQHFAISDSYK